MLRNISLQQEPPNDRVVLRVGCQTLFFPTMDLAAQALMLYLRDPEVADQVYMLAIDQLQHREIQGRLTATAEALRGEAPSTENSAGPAQPVAPTASPTSGLGRQVLSEVGHIAGALAQTGLNPRSAAVLEEAIYRIELDARRRGYEEGRAASGNNRL